MILFVSLFLANTAMGIDKTNSRRFIETNATVASCSICEKRQKELEEQEKAMSRYHSHAIIHRKEQR